MLFFLKYGGSRLLSESLSLIVAFKQVESLSEDKLASVVKFIRPCNNVGSVWLS